MSLHIPSSAAMPSPAAVGSWRKGAIPTTTTMAVVPPQPSVIEPRAPGLSHSLVQLLELSPMAGFVAHAMTVGAPNRAPTSHWWFTVMSHDISL